MIIAGYRSDYEFPKDTAYPALMCELWSVHWEDLGEKLSCWLLTHWGLDKMEAISQMTFSSTFSLMKMFEFRFIKSWIKSSLKFVPKGQINNTPALVPIMACRRPGDKPLSEPMMVSLLTHICVTRPQWVKRFDSKFIQHNTLMSGDIYMHKWTGPSLVKIKACPHIWRQAIIWTNEELMSNKKIFCKI